MDENALFETIGLSKSFGGLRALHGVDINVRRGSVHAIIGPNGAGKTTFFNVIVGMWPPSAGQVRLDGEDITALKPKHIVERGITKSFQITNIFFNFTVRENLRFACQVKEGRLPLLASRASLKKTEERTDWLLETLGLTDQSYVLAGNLSHGKQRYLEIGIALASEPKLLLLDEPTAGMTSGESLEVAEFIKSLANKLTILMIEHDMKVIMRFSDIISVLHYGIKVFEGSPQEVRNNPQVQEIYFGKGLIKDA